MKIAGHCSFRSFFRIASAAVCTLFPLLFCELGEEPLAPKISARSPDESDTVFTDNMWIRAIPDSLNAGYDAQTTVEAAAFDGNHNPIVGKEILFTATKGIVTAKDTTDKNGIAHAVYTADLSDGEVLISAHMVLDGSPVNVTATVHLTGSGDITAGTGKNMRVRAVPPVLPAGSDEHSVIEVTVLNDDHNPETGEEIVFAASDGRITAKDTTDSNGIASALFSAGSSTGEVDILARMLKNDSLFSVRTTVLLVSAKTVVTSEDSNMRISVTAPVLPADYDRQTDVIVTVFDDNRNPVVDKEIVFSSTGGVITARDTTDERGTASAVFTSEPSRGNVTVFAQYLSHDTLFTAQTAIRLVEATAAIDSVSKYIRISAQPASIAASYDEQSMIQATVYDENRNPITGQEVLFSATGGLISAKDTTDENGIATAVFTSEPFSGDVIVYGQMVLNDSLFTAQTTLRLIGATTASDSVNKYMRIHATPSVLLASYDEQSAVEVTVFDDNRNPIVGKEIVFSAGRGTVTGKSLTDSVGRATATFTSEPVNENVVVSATMLQNDQALSVSTTITLGGVALLIIPQLSSAPLDAVVPVKIKLLDGKGQPLPDQQIRFSANGDSLKITNGAGEITTSVTRSSQGTVSITADALGASDSAGVYFGSSAPIDNDNTIRSLRLFSSSSQLRADNSDEVTVTAVIISEDNHNPLIGDTVQFSTTLGIIDRYGITDSSGRTSVTLRSAPVNGDCVVRALLKGNSAIKDSTTILFSGVTLELSVDREDVRINDTAVVRAFMKDGSGNPIGSDFVNFSVTSPAAFGNGARLVQAPLSATGIAQVKVVSGTAGNSTIHAASANVTDSIIINFTTNNLVVSSSKPSITVGGSDSARITARYLDRSGNPLSGKTITFATNAGTITEATAVTSGSGEASTWLKSGYFSAEATVVAKSSDASAYTSIDFTALSPGAITLSATPDNIGINGGTAALIATVKDDSGNVVSGAEVTFRILKGPGGGEHVDEPIIASTNDGIARAQFLAGSLPSTYRGCEIEATVGGLVTTTKLTISGEPHTITISRPEDDTVEVPNGGKMDESTFDFFIGAVVKDVNGNPVADGTPVNFSAFVSGMSVARRVFDRFETVGGDVKALCDYRIIDIPFEDINGNFKFDPGIDLDLDGYPTVASRGDNRNGDELFEYNIHVNGIFWDFNLNGICDTASDVFLGEPYYEASFKVDISGDTTYEVYADLNRNGRWDRYECTESAKSTLPAAAFTTPYGFDFEFWRWEMRPQFYGKQLDFTDNDFALVIDKSAVTEGGVAYTRLTYPRQFANRLFATVNAEVKGIRDRDGERFVLPVVRQ